MNWGTRLTLGITLTWLNPEGGEMNWGARLTLGITLAWLNPEGEGMNWGAHLTLGITLAWLNPEGGRDELGRAPRSFLRRDEGSVNRP